MVIFLWLTYQSLKGESQFLNILVYPLKIFQTSSTNLMKVVESFFDDYIFLLGKIEENKELKSKVAEYMMRENEFRETLAENRRLRSILELKREKSNYVNTAEVYAKSPTNWFHTIKIDKGKSDGIQENMIALAPTGLIGRVHRSMRNSSDIILITDPNFAVSVRLQTSRIEGILAGKGKEKCFIKYVSNDEEVEIGEKVITSGLDGLFPKGLLIGTVSKVKKRRYSFFQKIEITPSAKLNALEEIIILKK